MLRTILIIALMIQVALCFPQDAHKELDSSTIKYQKEVHLSTGNQQGLFDAIFQKVIVTNTLSDPTDDGNVVYTKKVYSTDTANGSTEDNEILKQDQPANGHPSNEQESSTVRYVKEYHVRNPSNGFFDAIFQIPIQTLAAVNNLVNQATGNSYRKEIRVNAVQSH